MGKTAAILIVLIAVIVEGCAGGKDNPRSRIPDCEDVPNGQSGFDCMNRPDR
jgi:hypothetical protein